MPFIFEYKPTYILGVGRLYNIQNSLSCDIKMARRRFGFCHFQAEMMKDNLIFFN